MGSLDFDMMRWRMMGLPSKDRAALMQTRGRLGAAETQAGATKYSAFTSALSRILQQRLANKGGIEVANIGASADRYQSELAKAGQLGAAELAAGARRYGADKAFEANKYFSDAYSAGLNQRQPDLAGVLQDYYGGADEARAQQEALGGTSTTAQPPTSAIPGRDYPASFVGEGTGEVDMAPYRPWEAFKKWRRDLNERWNQ